MTTQLNLGGISRNVRATIIGFRTDKQKTEIRLREIGFAEGDVVEVLHVGLFGGSPLNVRLHGTSIALRPKEARMILVAPIKNSTQAA